MYSMSFSATQRLGGHIPRALEAHNKSKTQTTQSPTRSIPSLSSLYHPKYSRRLDSLDIDSAWSCACIPFYLPRPTARTFLATSHFVEEAWHTFHLACHFIDHWQLPRRPLFSPARGLVRSPSLLPREQHINNTAGLALLQKPSARFLRPEARHASSVIPHPMLCFGQLLDC